MYQGRQRQQAELRRSAAHLPWEEVAWFVAHRQGPALYQGGSRGPVCSSRPRARLCTKAGSSSRQSCGARQRTSRWEEVARFVDHGRGPGCVPRLVMAARRGGRASGRRRPSIGVHRVADRHASAAALPAGPSVVIEATVALVVDNVVVLTPDVVLATART